LTVELHLKVTFLCLLGALHMCCSILKNLRLNLKHPVRCYTDIMAVVSARDLHVICAPQCGRLHWNTWILPTKFRHPRDFTNKIPKPSSLFRTFPGPIFLSEVLRSGVRCFTVHCNTWSSSLSLDVLFWMFGDLSFGLNATWNSLQ
jgi:hypothetical protein